MRDATSKRLQKAGEAVRAAETLLRDGHGDFAVGRAYYAMFYAAEALLYERGLRFRSHGEVHGAFGLHFIKSGILPVDLHRWLIDGYDQRISGDYWTEAVVTEEDARQLIVRAQQFLETVRQYLHEHPEDQ